MPIEISPGQIIWVDCADEEEVPKSDENKLVLDFPGPEYKNKVEKAVNSQNSAKPSKPEEVESEVKKIHSQVFENQEFVQLTKKKAELDKKAKKDKKVEIKTITEDPFGKWEKLEDTDIFDIPTGPIKLLTLTPNSFGPKCSKKRNFKRQAGL